jgi:hypothetical protein
MKKENLADPGYQHLKKAAEQIVETFKTPAEFLQFLTDALGWVYDYGISVGDSHPGETHFILRDMISNIAIPWFLGGEKFIHEMTGGIGEIACETREEFYLDDAKYVIKAYGRFIAETGSSSVESTSLDMDGIICLMNIASCIRSYHLAKQKEDILA